MDTLMRTATAIAWVWAGAAMAAAEPGQPAPDFTARNLAGEPVGLAQFRGRTVVLEWNNPNCPYVRKHYDSGNMQRLQRAKGEVVWLAVNSTNPESGDFMGPAALARWLADGGAAPSHYLPDPDGRIGRAYGAKTTPHMYVIDGKGTLVYAGAIDDRRSANVADVPGARNHVAEALAAVAAGRPVANASTQPYGCSVKY
ncbi:MAG: redoxin domain-containing protein [Rhodocyclaceae bacterium]|nr:redoxin domain-containing protein [Rhodocyclaceae bacterium]